MPGTQTFRDLIAWQKAIRLVRIIYQITRRMPEEERFGLVVQMRRCAVSIPSNIAEGNARRTRRDYLRFLSVARGSLAELETQLIIAQELNMLDNLDPTMECLQEVDRILQGLIRSLQNRSR